MNVNQIINMIMRQLTRRLVNKGVDAGIDMASRRGKSKETMTDEERAQAQLQARQSKDMVKRAKRARRLTRKFF